MECKKFEAELSKSNYSVAVRRKKPEKKAITRRGGVKISNSINPARFNLREQHTRNLYSIRRDSSNESDSRCPRKKIQDRLDVKKKKKKKNSIYLIGGIGFDYYLPIFTVIIAERPREC